MLFLEDSLPLTLVIQYFNEILLTLMDGFISCTGDNFSQSRCYWSVVPDSCLPLSFLKAEFKPPSLQTPLFLQVGGLFRKAPPPFWDLGLKTWLRDRMEGYQVSLKCFPRYRLQFRELQTSCRACPKNAGMQIQSTV